MLSFKIKKLGNYWYPDIDHVPNQLYTFDEKLNRYLTVFAGNSQNEITFNFEEFDDILIYDDKQDTELSLIANGNIALGTIGDQNSILANVTIIKKEDN